MGLPAAQLSLPAGSRCHIDVDHLLCCVLQVGRPVEGTPAAGQGATAGAGTSQAHPSRMSKVLLSGFKLFGRSHAATPPGACLHTCLLLACLARPHVGLTLHWARLGCALHRYCSLQLLSRCTMSWCSSAPLLVLQHSRRASAAVRLQENDLHLTAKPATGQPWLFP